MFRSVTAFATPLHLLARRSSIAASSDLAFTRSFVSARRPLAAQPHVPRRRLHATPATMTADNHLKEGDTVPSIVFKTRQRIPELEGKTENPFDWVDTTSEDHFKGKRVVVFALPGAFTPTCSSTHLPGYERDYDAITALGVDAIYCLSVNDAFVMFQWGKNLKAEKVKMLPDGAALFTEGMKMSCTWTSERGFGLRSWRYSMVVNDMKIEKMFVEPNFVENSGPDPFEVSDSTTMLNYLKSVAK